MDMTITEPEQQDITKPDLTNNLPTEPNLPSKSMPSNENQPNWIRTFGLAANLPCEILSNDRGTASSEIESRDQSLTASSDQNRMTPQRNLCNNSNVYQVYNLHNIELYKQPQFPVFHKNTSPSLHKNKGGKRKQQLLLKSLSKDSSFSSIESLPDLLGGLVLNGREGGRGVSAGIVGYWDGESEREGSRGSSRRSESESGIVSDTGETEMMTNSEIQVGEDDHMQEEEKEAMSGPGSSCKNVSAHKENGQIAKTGRGMTEDNREEKGWGRDVNGGGSRNNTGEKKLEEKRKKHKRGAGEAVEILINGRGILTPADSDSEFEDGSVVFSKPFISNSEFKVDQYSGLETPPHLSRRVSTPSHGSSLESLLALGVELFPSKDPLHRSASLESCLAPCRSTDGETGGSLASLGELSLGEGREREVSEPGRRKNNESAPGEASSGELSRRTLDLLKCLENIQSPLPAKMTRSVSDMTLRNSSLQRSRLPASPSLGGRLSGVSCSSRKGPPSLINESSVSASLTELSSTEDSSLASDDFATVRNQCHVFLDPSMAANANPCSFRKRSHGNNHGGQGLDESDATSLSMVVNVSCTSACTDEDEDDSDLLSSSTLTLTEEELGIRDGEDEDEDRLSGASSGNEDDDGEEMEGPYILGLEYMKRELQSWIRPLHTSSSSSKTEAGLRDELQCGANLSSTFTSSSQNKEQHCFLNSSAAKLLETYTNSGNNKTKSNHDVNEQEEKEEENKRNTTRSYINQFVDDVENGNVDQSMLRGKDEDDELLREESSVFTKKGESFRESGIFANVGESLQDVESSTTKTILLSSSPPCEVLSFLSKHTSSLVGQLRGELPCHSSSIPSPPSLSPVENSKSHDTLHSNIPTAGGRKAITIQEKFKFSSLVTEESRREVRDKESSLPPKRRHSPHSSCCSHLPFSSPSSSLHLCHAEEKKEKVHDFVMEIIDMTSLALKSKEIQAEEVTSRSNTDQGSASLAHIRDKVQYLYFSKEHKHLPTPSSPLISLCLPI